MSDDGSNLFRSERFRYNREKLIEEAGKFVADIRAKDAAFKAAYEAYQQAMRKYALDNYSKFEPRVNLTYHGIEVEFNIPMNSAAKAALGIEEPTRERINLGAADEVEKALKIVRLGDGEYVPAKMAESITKWLTQ